MALVAAPQAREHLTNCLVCGLSECNSQNCIFRTTVQASVQQQNPLKTPRHKLESHLKYTNTTQRTQPYDKKRRTARNAVLRSFTELDRATPGELAAILIEDGLLSDLSGTFCVHSSCSEHTSAGYTNDRKLGHLCATNCKLFAAASSKNAYYRCVTCRNRVAINRGSIIYPPLAGAYGVKERTLAYWNLIHGASLTLTANQLRLSNDCVSSFYDTARDICAKDAIRREKK